ncbi:MAG: lipopolysaccharide assembly protein LapB [Pseudomonadota bacterium]|nr:lipopolysaccharide assembly protein LapB [Pseudomonadota bacterium]
MDRTKIRWIQDWLETKRKQPTPPGFRQIAGHLRLMWEALWLLIPLAAALGWFAAKHFSSAARTDPHASATAIPEQYIKGLNFLLDEQPDKALEVFTRIVEVDPDTVETHIVLGNLFRRRGEVDRAIRVHQNLVERSSLSVDHKVDGLLELGRDYLRAGLLDRAEVLFKEVVQIGGQARPAYRHLREIYEQEKDWTNAIETAVRLQNDCGVPQGEVIAHYYCELCEDAIKEDNDDQASRYARKALEYDRGCARASVLLGDVAFKGGNYKSAIRSFGDVHAQRPEFVSLVLPRLKESYNRCGDSEGYLRLLQRIGRNNPSPSVMLSMVAALKQMDGSAVDQVLTGELSRPFVPLKIIREFIEVQRHSVSLDERAILGAVAGALDSHLERQASHLCHRCGLATKDLYWRCPSCHGWGTIKPVEQVSDAIKPLQNTGVSSVPQLAQYPSGRAKLRR